jgi:hypothetical protein
MSIKAKAVEIWAGVNENERAGDCPGRRANGSESTPEELIRTIIDRAWPRWIESMPAIARNDRDEPAQ